MHHGMRTGAPRRLLTGALLLAASLTLPSCASLDAVNHYPTVPEFCPSGDGKAACKDLPLVAEQVRQSAADADTLKKSIRAELVASSAADVATFGLAAAFGVKLVHGNTLTNGAKNLAYAAGTSYVASTLFFPRSTEQAQLGARTALTCVAARGNDLLGAYSTQQAQLDAAWDQVKALPKDCQSQPQFAAMIGAHDAAQAALHSVQGSQVSLAQLLFRARLAAHDSLQAQLEAQRPNPQAYLAAGNSALTTAGSLEPAGTPATAGGGQSLQSVTLLGDVPAGACESGHLKTIGALQSTFEGAKHTLDETVNAVADAGKDCVTVTPTLVAPLSVLPTTVALHAGENGTVVAISGGRPPIRADWVGELPKDTEAKTSWLVADQRLLVYAPASAAGGKSYTLRVQDSAARPARLDIPVTTAK